MPPNMIFKKNLRYFYLTHNYVAGDNNAKFVPNRIAPGAIVFGTIFAL
jgi:hypothetical protein